MSLSLAVPGSMCIYMNRELNTQMENPNLLSIEKELCSQDL